MEQDIEDFENQSGKDEQEVKSKGNEKEKEIIKEELKKGVSQWASISVNCYFGCRHDCRYCYARQMSARFKREKGEWNQPIPNDANIKKNWRKRDGVIMFPTSHDITPDIMENCLNVLAKLLKVENEVLLVSKMHIEIAREIVKRFKNGKRPNVRVTIGSCDNADLKKWEPGAPLFEERLECLKLLYNSGFNTSVSAEPMLNVPKVDELIKKVYPFSNEIWLGKMNYLHRVLSMFPDMKKDCEYVKLSQTNEKMIELYEKYKNDKKIKWKHSILLIINRKMETTNEESKEE